MKTDSADTTKPLGTTDDRASTPTAVAVTKEFPLLIRRIRLNPADCRSNLLQSVVPLPRSFPREEPRHARAKFQLAGRRTRVASAHCGRAPLKDSEGLLFPANLLRSSALLNRSA